LGVSKNREAFCIFVKNIPSNVKGKTKKIIIIIFVGTAILLSKSESVEAIGMIIRPQQTVVMVSPDYNRLIRPSNVSLNFQNQPKIMMKSQSISKPGQISLPVYIYMTDERFLSTPEVSKLIKNLRDESLTEVSFFIALLGVIVFMASNSRGFVRPSTRVVPSYL